MRKIIAIILFISISCSKYTLSNMRYKVVKHIELINAIKDKKDIKYIKELIKQVENINDTDRYSNTALHVAIINDNIAIVTMLIEAKADIEVKNWGGKTPFRLAIENNKLEIDKYFDG